MAAFIPNGFEGPNKTPQVRIFVVQEYEVPVPSCKQIVHFHQLRNSLQGRDDHDDDGDGDDDDDDDDDGDDDDDDDDDDG